MFTKQKIVIAITKQSVQVSTVALEHPPRKLQTKTYPLSDRNLTDILVAIAPHIKNSEILVLISDDLSYTLSCTIPKTSTSSDERAAVARIIKTEIPEILENNEWDFKETKLVKDTKEVLVFAPIKKFFNELSIATTKASLTIEAIEPASIAAERHEDPIIGIALKKDIKGKDEEVLNVVPAIITPSTQQADSTQIANSSHSSDTEVATASSSRKQLIIVAITLIVFTAIVIAGIYMVMNKNTPSSSDTDPEEIRTPTPIAQPTTNSSTPTPTPIDVTDITVHVLNGTGEAGASSAVRDALSPLDFKSIDVGNADSYTYTDTEIQKKDSVSDEIIAAIKDKLSDYTIVETNPLTSTFKYDVLIIVGESN
jgi:hypothetical protein